MPARGKPPGTADDAGPDGSAESDDPTSAEELDEGSAPAHGANDVAPKLDREVLETDRKRARDTATRTTIDLDGLADGLAALDTLLYGETPGGDEGAEASRRDAREPTP